MNKTTLSKRAGLFVVPFFLALRTLFEWEARNWPAILKGVAPMEEWFLTGGAFITIFAVFYVAIVSALGDDSVASRWTSAPFIFLHFLAVALLLNVALLLESAVIRLQLSSLHLAFIGDFLFYVGVFWLIIRLVLFDYILGPIPPRRFPNVHTPDGFRKAIKAEREARGVLS
jgi:hypothetical protein